MTEILRRGRIMDDNIINNNQPCGRKGTLPYTLACMVKVQAEPNVNDNDQERKGKRKILVGCPKWAVYLPMYAMYLVCQSVYARGGIHTTTLQTLSMGNDLSTEPQVNQVTC